MASLLRIAIEKEKGPMPSYTEAHLLLSFIIIAESKVIGRQSLAKRVGLGEGAIRTVLKKLKDEDFIITTASGCSLTKHGKEVYRRLKSLISHMIELNSTQLTVGDKQIAIAVRGVAKNVKDGIEQRDAAIRLGATGATTYVIKDSKFQIPNDSDDCERDFPSDLWSKIRLELKPKDGDVVIICGSRDIRTSMLGAISAALTLISLGR